MKRTFKRIRRPVFAYHKKKAGMRASRNIDGICWRTGDSKVQDKILYELAKMGAVKELGKAQRKGKRSESDEEYGRRRSSSSDPMPAIFHAALNAMNISNDDVPAVFARSGDIDEYLPDDLPSKYEIKVLEWTSLFQEAVSKVGEKQFADNLLVFFSSIAHLFMKLITDNHYCKKFFQEVVELYEENEDIDLATLVWYAASEDGVLMEYVQKELYGYYKAGAQFAVDSLSNVGRKLEKKRKKGKAPAGDQSEQMILDSILMVARIFANDMPKTMETVIGLAPDHLKDLIRGIAFGQGMEPTMATPDLEEDEEPTDKEIEWDKVILDEQIGAVMHELHTLEDELKYTMGTDAFQESDRRYDEKRQELAELVKKRAEMDKMDFGIANDSHPEAGGLDPIEYSHISEIWLPLSIDSTKDLQDKKEHVQGILHRIRNELLPQTHDPYMHHQLIFDESKWKDVHLKLQEELLKRGIEAESAKRRRWDLENERAVAHFYPDDSDDLDALKKKLDDLELAYRSAEGLRSSTKEGEDLNEALGGYLDKLQEVHHVLQAKIRELYRKEREEALGRGLAKPSISQQVEEAILSQKEREREALDNLRAAQGRLREKRLREAKLKQQGKGYFNPNARPFGIAGPACVPGKDGEK